MKYVSGKPIKWFKFCIYFRYPLTIVSALGIIAYNLQETDIILWLYRIHLLYAIMLIVSAVGAIYYGYNMKKQAIKYIFILVWSNVAYLLLEGVTRIVYGIPIDTQLNASFSAAAVWAILETTYYYKRLPLFYGGMVSENDFTSNVNKSEPEQFLSCRWCGKYFVKGEQVAVCKHCESFYHVSCVKKHVGCRCGSKDFYVRNMKQEESTETKEDAIPVEEGELSREENINMREESVNIEPTDNMETESIKENSHLTEKNKHFKIKFNKKYIIIACIWCITLVVTAGLSSHFLHMHDVASCDTCKKIRYEARQEGYEEKAKIADEEIKEWKDKYYAVSSKARFLDNYIVLVTESGQKYHRYDCQYVEGKSFRAYNYSAAKSRGYTACSVCNPPQ